MYQLHAHAEGLLHGAGEHSSPARALLSSLLPWQPAALLLLWCAGGLQREPVVPGRHAGAPAAPAGASGLMTEQTDSKMIWWLETVC
jgi:hypothetical protein